MLKSSVEIMVSKSAEANISKLGSALRCVKRQREISTGDFASFASSLSLKKEHTQQTKGAHTHSLVD